MDHREGFLLLILYLWRCEASLAHFANYWRHEMVYGVRIRVTFDGEHWEFGGGFTG
jgi:hypothetical protein